MQHDAADQLDIVMPLPYRPDGRLPYNGKSLRQQRIQRFAVSKACTKLVGLGAKLLVRERLHAVFKLIYSLDQRSYLFNLLLARIAKQTIHESHFFSSKGF